MLRRIATGAASCCYMWRMSVAAASSCLVHRSLSLCYCPTFTYTTTTDECFLYLHGQVHGCGGQVCSGAAGADQLRHGSGERGGALLMLAAALLAALLLQQAQHRMHT